MTYFKEASLLDAFRFKYPARKKDIIDTISIAIYNIKTSIEDVIRNKPKVIMVIMLMALPLMSTSSIEGVMMYLFMYLFMNLGAFFVVIYVNDVIGGESFDDFNGLGWKMPYIGISMTLFMVALTGLPPTAGFVGKLGKPVKPTLISMKEKEELKEEISDLKANNKNIIAQNKSLLERLERLEKVALGESKSKDLATIKLP